MVRRNKSSNMWSIEQRTIKGKYKTGCFNCENSSTRKSLYCLFHKVGTLKHWICSQYKKKEQS